MRNRACFSSFTSSPKAPPHEKLLLEELLRQEVPLLELRQPLPEAVNQFFLPQAFNAHLAGKAE